MILVLYINGNWVCYITRLTGFVLLLSGRSCSNVDSSIHLRNHCLKRIRTNKINNIINNINIIVDWARGQLYPIHSNNWNYTSKMQWLIFSWSCFFCTTWHNHADKRESTKFPLAPLPHQKKRRTWNIHSLFLLLLLSVANAINNFVVLQKTASTHAINDAKKMWIWIALVAGI